MTSVLLSDPVLQLLSPLDLIKVRQVCKESRDVVEQHRATQSHYTVQKECNLPWKTRERLYSLYPSVKHLTLELGGNESAKMYLRPTLQSIHLTFPIQITRLQDYNEWYLRNTWDFTESLLELCVFLEAHPEAELYTVRLSFQSTVKLFWEDEGEDFIGYDRDGPLYEKYDLSIKIQSKSPEDYLWLIEPRQLDLKEIQAALTKLVGLRKWKRFEMPEAFPGANLCPTATLLECNPYDEEEFESMEEYVYGLFHQKLRRDSGDEVRYSDGF